MIGNTVVRGASNFVYNRNPRSLEKICIAYKPRGWHLDDLLVQYWHKLVIEKSARHVTAFVQHYTGAVPVTASTKEWAIRKHLYSPNDRSAYINLARVLALRCIKTGITEMATTLEPPKGEPQNNVDSFLLQMIKDGISLTEPNQYINPRPSDKERPEKPWEIYD